MDCRTHPEQTESSHDAVRLWCHLFGDRRDLVEVFTAFRSDKGRLEMPKAEHFDPDRLEAAAKLARWHDQERTREAYFCAHQLLAPQRVKDNAAPIRALWADVDDADLAASPIAPTALVESSPGRHQAYAVLSRPIMPVKAEQLNKRWALAFGADPSGFDLTQLLRVPGTRNHKYPGAPLVKLLYVDDARTYDPDELERILPPLPEPKVAAMMLPSEALSTDDDELLATLERERPTFRKLRRGDVSDYADEHGKVDPSDVDWGAAQDLARACAGDVDRAERLMRQLPIARDKWDERRNGSTWLRYTLERAAAAPSLNGTPQRSDDPRTWPTHEALPGPSNGTCSEHCRQHEEQIRELQRQVHLTARVLRVPNARLSPVFKVVILALAAEIGFHSSKGESWFVCYAKRVAEAAGLGEQTVRKVLAALAREHGGLIEKRTTRTFDDEAHDWRSTTRIEPRVEGGTLGFLEAALEFEPEQQEPRERHTDGAGLDLPDGVEPIVGCPDHPMRSREVVCTDCGEVLVEEVRYYALNSTPQRSEVLALPWLTSGDEAQRSGFGP